jgi:centromere/kinetochore protein ZW10
MQQTRIHERIKEDLPEFNRHLETSKSVQNRLQLLSSNVDTLHEALHQPEVCERLLFCARTLAKISPKTGLVPQLLKALTVHSTLTQEAAHAATQYAALAHLRRCRRYFLELQRLVNGGQLAEAVKTSLDMEQSLANAPSPLSKANVLVNLWVRGT